MTAKKYYLRQWENENHRLLLLSLQVSQKKARQAARLASFLLYLVYGSGKLTLALGRSLLRGPELIRRESPERYLERHEFEKKEMTSYPQLWGK